MDMITQEIVGLPVYVWVVLLGFGGFIVSRVIKSRKRKSGGGSGGGGGGGGTNPKLHK